MEHTVNIEKLLSEVRKLDNTKKIDLISQIQAQVNRETKKTSTKNLKDLKGLGASLWQKVNIEEYLNEERKWS